MELHGPCQQLTPDAGQVLKNVGYNVTTDSSVTASMDAASMDLQDLCSLQLQVWPNVALAARRGSWTQGAHPVTVLQNSGRHVG